VAIKFYAFLTSAHGGKWLAALHTEKISQNPMGRMLGGPQSQCGHGGKVKILPVRSRTIVVQLIGVTLLTEVFHLAPDTPPDNT
jgi:hypothetical protein